MLNRLAFVPLAASRCSGLPVHEPAPIRMLLVHLAEPLKPLPQMLNCGR